MVIAHAGDFLCLVKDYLCDTNHEGLTAATSMVSQMEDALEMFEAREVGSFCMDDALYMARAQKILALFMPWVIFVKCMAHQMNLLMKDILAVLENDNAAAAFKIITTLSRSLAKWGRLLRDCCKEMYGRQ